MGNGRKVAEGGLSSASRGASSASSRIPESTPFRIPHGPTSVPIPLVGNIIRISIGV